MQDYFSLFDLPEGFALNLDALDQAYRRVQAQVHPDRFADRSEAERRVAMQWATLANEAYRGLRNPVARARYLLARRGAPLDDTSTAMPADFLMEQITWREALDDGRDDVVALQALREQLQAQEARMLAHLQTLMDAPDEAAAAAQQIRCLMFIEKLGVEIDDALALQDH